MSSRDGHPRVILSKVMTSGYKHIRLFATQHLGNILKNEKTDSNDWAIQLLCTQVSDKCTFPRFSEQDVDNQLTFHYICPSSAILLQMYHIWLFEHWTKLVHIGRTLILWFDCVQAWIILGRPATLWCSDFSQRPWDSSTWATCLISRERWMIGST